MTARLRYLSVCSGIEAASVAWSPLGWQAIGFSEIEKFPRQVLAARFPDVINFGDMTRYEEWPIERGSVDVVIGGTPCQAFSVAGLRKGIADPRGNLALVYLGLVDRFRPTWIVWENVPGVLSSNGGRDFGSFLGGLEDIGYQFAYRVLDAQFWGVAQRRRRVFVVGHIGDWRRAAAVLFDGQSGERNYPPRRKSGEGIAADVAPSLTASGRGVARCGESRGQDVIVATYAIRPANTGANGHGIASEVAHTLDLAQGQCVCSIEPGAATRFGNRENVEISSTLRADMGDNLPVIYCEPVAPTVTSSGPPYSRMGNARVEADALVCIASGQANAEIADNVSPMLSCLHEVPIVAGTSRPSMRVRRITPIEAERLQGFPDGWTDIRPNGKPTPDGPRYKAIGNSMAVPVIRWIGERIAQVEAWK